MVLIPIALGLLFLYVGYQAVKTREFSFWVRGFGGNQQRERYGASAVTYGIIFILKSTVFIVWGLLGSWGLDFLLGDSFYRFFAEFFLVAIVLITVVLIGSIIAEIIHYKSKMVTNK
jgi:uncharacterized SAM-binding protein YcdF (DUF218 family)